MGRDSPEVTMVQLSCGIYLDQAGQPGVPSVPSNRDLIRPSLQTYRIQQRLDAGQDLETLLPLLLEPSSLVEDHVLEPGDLCLEIFGLDVAPFLQAGK